MTPATPALSRHLALLTATLFFVSCGGSDSPTDAGPDVPTAPPPTVGAVAVLSAPGAQVVGSTVSIDIRVDDTTGQAMSGTVVSFSVTSGTVSPTSATTNAIGVAQVSWTLGTAPGSQTLTATASGRTATVAVQTEAGPASAFEMVSGDGQSGAAGDALATPLVVSVKDAFGNAKEGETVAVAVTAGGGSVAGSSTSTGADGQAAITWTLGSAVGGNTLTASHPLGTITFTATAQAGAPATIEKVAGDNQTALVETALPTAPGVRVTDSQGNPVGGVAVTFAVTSGGGSITGATASTASDGTAALGGWTLGATPGANTLSATVEGVAPATFTATATSASSLAYNIDLRFVGTIPASIKAAFDQAKARWEQVIIGNLSSGQLTSEAGDCFDAQPAVDELVDDIIIFAEVAAIDGVGNTLGQAGPCYTRFSNGLTLMGAMTFDEADLTEMETEGTLTDVILHEMGHVLGVGSLWEEGELLQGAGTDDPFFSGTNAVAAYTGLGGVLINGVPVENTGEEGTRDGHWRESMFQNELMTGYISEANNPLSVVTVRSLVDQGYTVNDAAADAYTIPTPSSAGAAQAPTRRVGRWEVLLRPIGTVMPDGRIRPVR